MNGLAAVLRGDHADIGYGHGEAFAQAVRHNLQAFWAALREQGWHRDEVLARAVREEGQLSPSRLEEAEGIARGARVDMREVLAYNLYHGRVFPDECTVMFALGDCTASGRTLFLKNSDKIGSAKMVGPNFYGFKEINVVLAIEPAQGPSLLVVSAAGSTGCKMGVSSAGVCAGTNISRTVELSRRAVKLDEMRALDRVQLARDALERGSALAATQYVLARLAEVPQATPGNLEFVDSRRGYIIEGSYDRLALQVVESGFAVRTNMFVVLRELNDPEDLSSQCRYVRAQQLLRERSGKLVFDDFIAFSMDHGNGPGPNSICRHGEHYEEETSQSAMVVELDPASPAESRVAVALGKPCHAWRHPEGHVTVRAGAKASDFPEGFLSGETWKRFWTEEPYEPARAVGAAAGER